MRKSSFSNGLLVGLAATFLISGPIAFADPNLVSWWKFDEGTGSTAYDSAGSDNGIINGATWTTEGKIGGALGFDGVNDYVDLGTNPFATLTKGTISAWIKPVTTDGARTVMSAKQGTDIRNYMVFRILNGKLQIQVITSTYLLEGTGGTVLQTDTWYHVVYTTDSTGNHLYVNGSPETVTYAAGGTGTNAFFGHLPTGQVASIGILRNYNSANVNPFNGKIDDVRVYNRTLSAGEIWQLYLEGVWLKASNPNPANGAIGVNPNTVLGWSSGKDAASHDVYLGMNLNDVNNANTSSPEYKGNFDVNIYAPTGLDFVTTYYWRIDEVNEPNLWKGDVWNFETARPVIGLSATQFQFTAGGGANPDDQILGISNIGAGALNWQINEDCDWLSAEPNCGSSTGEVGDVNLSVDISGLATGMYTCNLTISDPHASNNPQIVSVNLVVPGLISWWKFDEGSGSTAYDSKGSNNGTITGAVWFNDPCRGICLSFDGSGDYVSIGNTVTHNLAKGTFAAWVYPVNLSSVCGGYNFAYIIGANNASGGELALRVNGDGSGWACVQTGVPNGYLSFPAGSINVGSWHHVAMTWDGSYWKLYVNGVQKDSKSFSQGTSSNTANAALIGKGWDGCTWNGKIDDVRFYSGALSAGEIWQLYRESLWPKASYPNPNDGTTGVAPNTVLSWQPGKDAASHNVYFGTSYNNVNDADTSSPEYKGNFDVNSFDPGGLDFFTNYYWRIDEVNEPNLCKGDVWSFETGGPEIGLSATQVLFTALLGGANPAEQILGISNSGIRTLNWQVSEDCGWLSAEPNSGTSTGEVDDVNLMVDISGLAAGRYTRNLTVSDPNASNNPQMVDVTLYVIDGDGILCVPLEYLTIQAAIDASVDGNTIVVAPGTYTGTGNRDIDFKGKAITVRSIDPNDPSIVAATVIDCENSGRGFYFHIGENENSVVSGLTITRGKITGNPAMGGGIYCNGSSPKIENCIITDNSVVADNGVDAYGGGICINSDSNPVIENCVISNNHAIGGKGANESQGRYAEGGGIYCGGQNCSITINRCLIRDNQATGGIGGHGFVRGATGGAAHGAGICCLYPNSVTISNCIISGNLAVGGQGGSGYSDWRSDGGPAYGGGLFLRLEAESIINNCTVTGNQVKGGEPEPNPYGYDGSVGSAYGAGIEGGANTPGDAKIQNCIVWNNSGADEIANCNAAVTYSNVKGGYSGTGNINTDPLFVNAAAGDFRLLPNSPCIDKGNNSAVPTGIVTDLDGRDRFVDGDCNGTVIVDMGAYEFTHAYFGDLDSDCHVDFIDFAILADFWLTDELLADIAPTPAGDGIVDASDLAVLCNNWLESF